MKNNVPDVPDTEDLVLLVAMIVVGITVSIIALAVVFR